MSFSISTNDITAFIDAQDELRAQAGTTADFGVPTAPQWPAGTPINPDTNKPYDATVVPANAAYNVVPVTVLVVEKAGSARAAARDTFTPSGLREGIDVILDVSAVDYEATVAQASMFTLNGEDYNIEEGKPFSFAGTVYRYLVYGAVR